MHIDTGHNFPEALEFRDLLVRTGWRDIDSSQSRRYYQTKNLTEPKGKFASRNWLQTYTLLDAIEELKCDACIGGGRRDEEKARAKERIFQCAMNLDNGTQNFNDQSFGVFTTDEFTRVKMFAHSQSATGQNWMSGITSAKKR